MPAGSGLDGADPGSSEPGRTTEPDPVPSSSADGDRDLPDADDDAGGVDEPSPDTGEPRPKSEPEPEQEPEPEPLPEREPEPEAVPGPRAEGGPMPVAVAVSGPSAVWERVSVLVPASNPDRPPTADHPPADRADAEPDEELDSAGRPGLWTRVHTRVRVSRAWRWGRWIPVAAVGTAALAALGLLWLFATVDLPSDPPERSSTVLLDTQGRELAVLSRDELQVPVTLDEISPAVLAALVAAEDRSFHDHRGIDPIGITRALYRNITSDSVEGASTITQQLVKNEFLTSERTWRRKVEEAVLAVKLERRADKRAILERYLNGAYFGRGSRGIDAAARVYFGRSARELTTSQAAYLVGMLPRPSGADPVSQPVEALQRRDNVLAAMVASGALTPVEAEAARSEPLEAAPTIRPVTLTARVGSHFVDRVGDELIDRYGEAAVYGTGLRVRTTINIDDQRAAEAEVASALDDPADPQAALVALDRSGAVRAYVGSRPGSGTHVDHARGVDGGGAGRQAGSTFKPFALVAALEKGIPLTRTWPAPPDVTLGSPSGPWTVHNYGNQDFGTQSLLDATASSVNTVYAQLAVEVGPAAVADAAHRAGIDSRLGANPSIVLGVDDVSPTEMAAAYLTFARDGSRADPYTIAEVRDRRGELVAAHEDTSRPVLDPGVARAVNHALQQVVARGTGTAARLARPVAGKTGTTESNGDAWFAGYTPDYAAVVWMGYPEGPQRRMTDVHGRTITGGTIPAELWKAFADVALPAVPPTPFSSPPSERVDGTPAPPAVALQRPVVAPGDPVRLTIGNFGPCGVGLRIELRAVELERGVAAPAPRSSTLAAGTPGRADVGLPADAPEGLWKVVARCDDSGTAAEATFRVAASPPDRRAVAAEPPPD